MYDAGVLGMAWRWRQHAGQFEQPQEGGMTLELGYHLNPPWRLVLVFRSVHRVVRVPSTVGQFIASAIRSLSAGAQPTTALPRRNPSLARKSLTEPPASSTSNSPASASHEFMCSSQ